MNYLYEIKDFFQNLVKDEIFKIFLSFVLGFLSSFGIAKIVEKQKLNKLRKFYLSWLKFSVQNVIKQLERYKSYNEKIKNNFNLTENLEFNRSQLEQVSNLSKEELYDIFVLRKCGNVDLNAKTLHELVGCIDYLITFDNDLFNKYLEFRSEMKEINSKLAVVLPDFISCVDRYILKYLNTPEGFANEILALKESLGKNYSESTINPDIYFKELVDPCRVLLVRHLMEEPAEIIIQAKEKSQNFKDILYSRNLTYTKLSDNLIHYIKQIEKTINNLNSKIKYLEKK
jgi:hypothetical protein